MTDRGIRRGRVWAAGVAGLVAVAALAFGPTACGDRAAETPPTGRAGDGERTERLARREGPPGRPPPERPTTVFPKREAFFGDLHVHTSLSLDAYLSHTRSLPDDAYRYAKGEPIAHVSGQRIRIRTPLDFMAVTDHAELLGTARAMADPDDPLSDSPIASDITSEDDAVSKRVFDRIVRAGNFGRLGGLAPLEHTERAARAAWQQVIGAAERHNEPGRFTTFIGYEWTSSPAGANLHRNVIFAGSQVPELPFSSVDSEQPEDLWAHLEAWREQGSDVIAIPHNGNASMDRMYPQVDSYGKPIDAEYAARRMRNEPVGEVTQSKGTSETHGALSPRDEFADFELWNRRIGNAQWVRPEPGSYIRSALLRGLALQARGRGNPYAFSLIGSSDSHDASSAVEESNFTGGHGNADATPEARLRGGRSALTRSSLLFGASGLAGVWATENTRESIFASIQRGETFATSGPRIRVRLFAGVRYPRGLHRRKGAVERAYAYGVPMGSTLPILRGQRPTLVVWGLRDPRSAPLERIQIVKGFLRAGKPVERIYDVVCSDGILPDPDTHRCPDNGATVDLETCDYSPDVGNGQLATTWTDPDYEPGSRAVYYARVLENPTCRWSTWDAIRLGVSRPRAVPATLRERAWSSPIWIEPLAPGG